MKNQIIIFSVCMGILASAQAQKREQLLDELMEDERSAVEALVLYSGETRLDILEVARRPELLVKLETLQSKSRDAFNDLLKPFPAEVQQDVWDLTRYPGLVADLAATFPDDPGELLYKYPEEIRPRARKTYREHPQLLTAANELSNSWNLALSSILREYPPATGEAMHRLLQMPEVLDILTEHIRMTVLVGDLYERQPAWLLQQMDSLGQEVAARRASELEDWRAGLEQNPAAKAEFIQAAEEFAGTYVYDDAYYEYDDIYYQEEISEELIVTHHYYFHYPYWFGYPEWFLYPRWRPYPWWWDWGFYWGPGRMVIISDFPSWYFMNWYFYRPEHHWRYAHLSSHFVNHYYGHRHQGSPIGNTVHHWQQSNRDIITEPWLEKSRFDANAFRQFGKFEVEREKYNHSHQQSPLSQQEYLAKKNTRYPALRPKAASPADQPTMTRPETGRRKPAPPAIEKPGTIKPPREVPQVKREDAAPARKPVKPLIPKIEKAREYHRDNWDQTKPEKKPEVRRPAAPNPRKPQAVPKSKPSKTMIPSARTRKG
ncbi:MAG: hypothetical protein RI973_399 [Bacteroidota bacterium]